MPTYQQIFRWFTLGIVVFLPRLAHSGVLWVEESYPMAGALQMLGGKLPYQGFVYDKPPLGLFFAALGAGSPEIVSRVLGAFLILLCCIVGGRIARAWWSEAEAVWTTALLTVGLTFYLPATVVPVAPDLLMLLPHLAAIYFARAGRPTLAGLMAGLAIWINSKGVLVALACGLWSPAAAVVGLALGALQLLIPGNWEQVWRWGMLYSADTFLERPLAEGLLRTFNWAGFHATAVLGTAVYFFRENRNGPNGDRWRMAAWLLLSLAGVVAGLRFFPRYYFQLLPVVALLGARGLVLLPTARRWALACLLLIPIVRFGPRYVQLAVNGDADWSDTALNRDSRAVSARIGAAASPQDTILVWGYRPDILVYTRLPLGAPFLDSQPLTGVIADRHLVQSRPSAPEVAAANRKRLVEYRPEWLVDGLGPSNPQLAIGQFPDLREWFANYSEAFRTSATVVYRRKP